MLARVATFDDLPDDLSDEAVDLLRATIRSVPGYVAGFHLVDPRSGKGLSIVVFEDMEAAERATAALEARPDDQKVGIRPDHVEYFEAAAF